MNAVLSGRLLDRYILPRWGQPLHRVRADALDQWYAELAMAGGQGERPLAAQSVINIHAVLRRALAQGVATAVRDAGLLATFVAESPPLREYRRL